MAQGAPDILALQELENGEVLRELAGGALAKYGYQWSYFAANPGAVLGTGLLSRLPLSELKVHSVTIAGETSPRPLLEARALAGDLPLVLFVCHWKSKTGGGETESRRRASAKALARRLLETREAEPDLPVIIMGDLNENHDEFYRLAQAALSALLPDDPAAWAVAEATASDGSGASAVAWELSGFAEPGKTGASGSGSIKAADFLVISGKKPPQPEYFPSDTAVLYSPWGQELEKGSYYYQGGWETIDHFLLSEALFDGLGWEFDDCEAPREEPFADSRGIPRAYNPRTGNGLSDHLPLLLRLKMRD
jgi:endonuclease/exonuclease/phosphatase family metal-dependent hydrolase